MTQNSVGRVAAVVLNWNGADDTVSCVEALQRQEGIEPLILIVDNASEDDSLDRLRPLAENDAVVLIENGANDGFAGGVNIGIRYALDAGCDEVALINNDALPEPDWLRRLVDAKRSSRAHIVTSLIIDERGEHIDSSGDYYSWWGRPFPRGRDEDARTASAAGFVPAASGGASLYDRRVFEDIGFFDEQYFAYYEDVDFSLRAQLRNHSVYYERAAIVRHKRGATSSRIKGFTTYQSFKNLPLLLMKNAPGIFLPAMVPMFLVLYAAMLVNAARQGRGRYAWSGVRDGFRISFSHGLRERRRIQGSRAIPAWAFTALLGKRSPWRR